MSFDAERLAALLPAVYRLRDDASGGPLRELLSIIAEQVQILEENLAQLYDDQFIETCADWVVPYIADLVGHRQLYDPASGRMGSTRAEVANTIRFRRRKGTAAMLEQLARDVTGWEASVVECFQRLSTTQYMNHLRPTNLTTPDLRSWEPLERLDTPFDQLAHTVDVRHIASGRGRYNVPNVAIFLWRLRSQALTGSPAFKVDSRRFLFSPVGVSTPLFTSPETEESISHLAEPLNVPMPISRRVLDANLDGYYGPGKSIDLKGVAIDRIVVCDLSDADLAGATWAHTPPAGKIAIDPVLGRIAMATAPDAPPLVTFHFGFSADLGGGEYDRSMSDRVESLDPQPGVVAAIPVPHTTFEPALAAVAHGGVVEIGDSGRYAAPSEIHAEAGARIKVRGVDGTRPTLVLNGDLTLSGAADAEVTLDGLLVIGGVVRVRVTGDHQRLRRLRLQHCTLVPGLTLGADGSPQQSAPSLVVETPDTVVEIDHCIVGRLRVAAGAQVQITNSIVDATAETGVAYAALDEIAGGAPLRIENSTVIGKVHTVLMEHVSNSILFARITTGDAWSAPVVSDRRQEGVVRFSYLPLESRVPRRYRCQPQSGDANGRIRPSFTSLRYGDAGYCQLTQRCPSVITRGAEDESEMGAFHDLYSSRRITNLRIRLDEYLRFGLEAGIFLAT